MDATWAWKLYTLRATALDALARETASGVRAFVDGLILLAMNAVALARDDARSPKQAGAGIRVRSPARCITHLYLQSSLLSSINNNIKIGYVELCITSQFGRTQMTISYKHNQNTRSKNVRIMSCIFSLS